MYLMDLSFKIEMRFIIFLFIIKALLKKCSNENERIKLTSDFKMLVEKEKMGSRFKLIALRKLDFGQPPPGFNQNI